jgi:electron transport complex protein RnfC
MKTVSQTLKDPKKQVKTVACIRCGVCMRVCPHNLSPILIKEAMDKQNFEQLIKLHAEMCEGCGDCNNNCPSRIDLRRSVLRAKAPLR